MADKNSMNDEEETSSFRRRRQRNTDDNSSDDMDATSDNNCSRPDISLGHSHRRNDGQNKFGDPSTLEGSRRDEPPSFSFKHFLQGHSNSSTGARPKVYDNPRYETKDNFNRRHNTPELASVLPDFVQDHLVVEQCYLAADSTLDIDNLPDFALSGTSELDLPLDLGQRNISEQLPFDLTQSSSSNQSSSSVRHNTSPVEDMYRLSSNRSFNRSPERVLPLDLAQSNVASGSNESLPLDLAQGSVHSRSCGAIQVSENVPCDLGLGSAQAPLDLGSDAIIGDNPTAGVHQSLPDFLSDGPIQCRESDQVLPGPEIVEKERSEETLLRRQLAEMSRRCEALEVELRRCREAAHHREEAFRRTTNELAAVRRENLNLRQSYGEGSLHQDVRTQRVARELMAAATQAEMSLRQLLSGVESLRLLASTLDQGPIGAAGPPHAHPSPRPSPSTSSHDFDPEDQAGPAL